MVKSYTDNPKPSHTLAADVQPINDNFLYLANTLGTSLKSGDHQVSINGADNTSFEGRHLQLSLKNRSGAPPTVAGLGDGVDSLLYSSNGNIFFDSIAQAGPYQLTTANSTLDVSKFGTLNVTSITTPYSGSGVTASTNSGWSFIPGGLIIQYGRKVNPSDRGSINFPVAFPTNVLGVFINFGRNATSTDSFWLDTARPNTLGTFSFRGSTAGADIFYWYAIGN